VDNIAEIMSNSDIAIGAAGSTAWERCCLGLPTIQMVISKNQSFSANMLAENHIVKPLKRAQDISLLLENLNEWLEPVRNKSKNFCDGLGSYRVFNRMSDCSLSLKKIGRVQLCNYINLNMNDKDTVMNMRNHIEIKRWMHNKNVISKKEHLDFIQQLEDDISRRYFLVKKEGKIVGSINFSNINLDNSAEFGIYTNPFEKIKYGGLILEESASFYVFNELKIKNIKLKVLTNNKRAIDFYKKCNFKKDKGKSNKEVLYMKKSDTFWNKL